MTLSSVDLAIIVAALDAYAERCGGINARGGAVLTSDVIRAVHDRVVEQAARDFATQDARRAEGGPQ